MQSHADTIMSDLTNTTTTTGMTLRSGNTYYRPEPSYGSHTYELDGEDFVPISSIAEFGWTWARTVHSFISTKSDWDAKTAYEFLSYLEATSAWCDTAWLTESKDTHEFGEYLMTLVRGFAADATSIKRYPNTRSKQGAFGGDLGYCHGIIRLANEIETAWNVSRVMHASAHQEEDANMVVSTSSTASPVDEAIHYESQSGYGHA